MLLETFYLVYNLVVCLVLVVLFVMELTPLLLCLYVSSAKKCNCAFVMKIFNCFHNN